MHPTLRRSGSQRLRKHPFPRQAISDHVQTAVTLHKRLGRQIQTACIGLDVRRPHGSCVVGVLRVHPPRSGQLLFEPRFKAVELLLPRQLRFRVRVGAFGHLLKLCRRFRFLPRLRLRSGKRIGRQTRNAGQMMLRLLRQKGMEVPARHLHHPARGRRRFNLRRKMRHRLRHRLGQTRLHQRLRVEKQPAVFLAVAFVDEIRLQIRRARGQLGRCHRVSLLLHMPRMFLRLFCFQTAFLKIPIPLDRRRRNLRKRLHHNLARRPLARHRLRRRLARRAARHLYARFAGRPRRRTRH